MTSAGILRQNTSPHTSSRCADRRVDAVGDDATSPRRPVTEKPRAQVALTLQLELRKQRAPAPDALDLIEQLQQIATGMEYLHALQPPVLHRDLKSANVLIAEGGQRLAIADFGLARYQANPGKKMTAETGSYRWMAPEVIRHEEYDKRCDVYSFAILAWEMLTYRVPFDNMSTC